MQRVFRPGGLGGVDAMKHRRQTCARSAFTLIETLLALAISAILLAAVATAFNASVINYRENQEAYETVNSARQALMRMTTQLRTGHSVQSQSGEALTQCSFHTSEDEDITYQYRAADHQLVLITNADAQAYVLCNNVRAMTFTKTPPEGVDRTSVRISMTVQAGDQMQTLCAATVIRRNVQL
jgi:prepilin-type N-terminal cleavage/methylation domain-containing protein